MIPVDDVSRLQKISVVLFQCRFVQEAVGAQSHGVRPSEGNWGERNRNATRLVLSVASLSDGCWGFWRHAARWFLIINLRVFRSVLERGNDGTVSKQQGNHVWWFMSFYGNLTTSMVLNFAIKSNYRIIKFAVVNKRSYVNTACGTLPHAG